MAKKPQIGVVAYQGAIPEHLRALERAGAETRRVKWPRDLEGLHGLVIPGGESTAIGDAMQHWGLLDAVLAWANQGGALYGTCAGAIIMATDILGGVHGQPKLGVVPMAVQRNGFGRQIDSCESTLNMPVLGQEPFHTVFIRAPYFTNLAPDVEELARFEDKVVAARYGHHLVTAFHPELTDDTRIHRLFIEMAIEGK